MRPYKWSFVVGAALLLVAASACSFTTANISSIKLSKDKEGTTQTTTFAPDDSIYASTNIANVPSTVTLKWRLITETVEGQPENSPVPQFDKSYDVPRDGVGTYYLTPPPTGWPAGKYRIEVSMVIENGEQKDFESIAFTVAR